MERRTNHVYVITRPGHDLDGEEHVIYGTGAEAADKALAYVTAYHCSLKKIGVRAGDVFKPCVAENELPWWALQQVAS